MKRFIVKTVMLFTAATLLCLAGCSYSGAEGTTLGLSYDLLPKREHYETIDPQDGLFYTYWERNYSAGKAAMDLKSHGFDCTVSSYAGNDIVCGKGIKPCWGETISWTVNTKVGGNYLGVYGWLRDPLVEYYIADGRKGPGDPVGEYDTDQGHYKLYVDITPNRENIIYSTAPGSPFLQFNCDGPGGSPINIGQHYIAWNKIMDAWWPAKKAAAAPREWHSITLPDYCVIALESWGSDAQVSVSNINLTKTVPSVPSATPLSFGPLTIDTSKTNYGVYGKTYCKFNDLAHLFNADGSGYGTIGAGVKDSMISGTMNIGVNAAVDDVKSNMAMTTFRYSNVFGSVFARGQVEGQAGGVVVSNINADVGALDFSYDSNKFITGSGSLTNNAQGQTFSISPGAYGDFNANNYNNITLSSGVYYFKSFRIGVGNTIYFPATGSVVLFAANDVQMHSGTKMLTTGTSNGADPSRILVVAGGSTYSILEPGVHWRGTFVAPNSEIVVNVDEYTGEFSPHPYTDVTSRHGEAYGAFYGKLVEVHQYNPLFSCPFDYNSLASMSPVPPSLSSNADLAGLTVSSGTLTPSFNPATGGYGVTVNASVTGVTITAAPADANATVTINGLPGNTLTVTPIDGTMRVTIRVTAQNTVNSRTYLVDVTRSSGGTVPVPPTTPTPITQPNTPTDVKSGTTTYTLTLPGGGLINYFNVSALDGITLADAKISVNGVDYPSSGYTIDNKKITAAASLTVVITTSTARRLQFGYWYQP